MKKYYTIFHLFFLLLGFLFLSTTKLYPQNSQTEFGRNRVQHKGFFWFYQRTTNFDIYFYKGGNLLSKHSSIHCEKEFSRITTLLGFAPESKIEIIIFNSLGDMQQSNVGSNQELTYIGGEANIFSNKVMIAYKGSMVDFENELSAKITEVILNEMMYGGSLQEMLQNALLLNLPAWFDKGLYAYTAYGWSTEMDDFLKSAIVNKRFRKASNMNTVDATFTGQSIWNFIVQKHGSASISNILNLTRLTRSVESAISASLGMDFDTFLQEWLKYYEDIYQSSLQNYLIPSDSLLLKKRNRKNLIFNHPKISPDGKQTVFTSHYNGKNKIVLRNNETGKKKTIFRGGFFSDQPNKDYNLPVLCWHPQDENKIGILYDSKGIPTLMIYNITTKEKTNHTFPTFSNVLDFNFNEDATQIVISAVMNGKTDIFVYNLKNTRLTQITNDPYDDLYPRFIKNSSAIIFSSNRLTDSTDQPKIRYEHIRDNYDLFLCYKKKGNTIMEKLTDNINKEHNPVILNENEVLYLSDENGINTVYKLNIKSKEKNQLTRFDAGIKSFDASSIGNNFVMVFNHKNREKIAYFPSYNFSQNYFSIPARRLDILHQNSSESEQYVKYKATRVQPDVIYFTDDSSHTTGSDSTDSDVNIYDYRFETEEQNISSSDWQGFTLDDSTYILPKENIINPLNVRQKDTVFNEEKIKISEPYPYGLRFNLAKIKTGFDFSPYLGLNFPVGVELNDFLENHRFEAYALILATFKNTSFNLKYTYLRERIDYSVSYSKFSISFENETSPSLQRFNRNELIFTGLYPFTETKSIKASLHGSSFANFKPLELDKPIKNKYAAGIWTEFILDNTLYRGLNLMEGVRLKTGLKTFSGDLNLYYTYFDARYYVPIHNELLFASRFACGFSGGTNSTKYLMGGMDAWLGATSDNNSTFEPAPATAFVTNMRGFNYNFRQGTRYMLSNFEIRFPVARYLYKGPITSNFLYNFQLAGFTDFGTIWEDGKSPFLRKNLVDTLYVPLTRQQLSVKVKILNVRNPVAIGYGFGIRSLLFGYFLKFDVAWGIENYRRNQPKFYLTFGMDF